MAKEREKRIRDAFATWLRSSSDLVTLAGGAEKIRADNRNAEVQVPSVTFSMNSQPFEGDLDSVFISFVDITCAHTIKPSMLDMIGAIEELAKMKAAQSSQRDASFSDAYVRTRSIMWIGSDELSLGVRNAATGVPLESAFQGSVSLQIIWSEMT